MEIEFNKVEVKTVKSDYSWDRHNPHASIVETAQENEDEIIGYAPYVNVSLSSTPLSLSDGTLVLVNRVNFGDSYNNSTNTQTSPLCTMSTFCHNYVMPGEYTIEMEVVEFVQLNRPMCTRTPEPTQIPTHTPIPTNTLTPTPSLTPTLTPTSSPTPTLTRTPTPTFTLTPTFSPTPTLTNTPSPTLTNTPSPTLSRTPTNTPTPTGTGVTPTPTGTGPTATPTRTPTNTPTGTVTLTPTNTPVSTNTPTPTLTRTPTPTLTRTSTPTPTVTNNVCVGNLITNGEFSTANVQQVGGTAAGWTLFNTDVHDISVYGYTGQPYNPFIDLVSVGSGNIGGYARQTVSTVPSQYYQLTFDIGADLQTTTSLSGRTVKVGINNGITETVQTYNLSANRVATSYASFNWTTRTIGFYASSNTTTISFSGYTENYAYGPVLDNVCLKAMLPPTPSATVTRTATPVPTPTRTSTPTPTPTRTSTPTPTPTQAAVPCIQCFTTELGCGFPVQNCNPSEYASQTFTNPYNYSVPVRVYGVTEGYGVDDDVLLTYNATQLWLRNQNASPSCTAGAVDYTFTIAANDTFTLDAYDVYGVCKRVYLTVVFDPANCTETTICPKSPTNNVFSCQEINLGSLFPLIQSPGGGWNDLYYNTPLTYGPWPVPVFVYSYGAAADDYLVLNGEYLYINNLSPFTLLKTLTAGQILEVNVYSNVASLIGASGTIAVCPGYVGTPIPTSTPTPTPTIAVDTYVFNINIQSIPSVVGKTASPPCPRVNAWAAPATTDTFRTSPTAYTVTLTTPAGQPAGVDIFTWLGLQSVSFTATGTYSHNTSLAGVNNDQVKTQIMYQNNPGTYNITIAVSNS